MYVCLYNNLFQSVSCKYVININVGHLRTAVLTRVNVYYGLYLEYRVTLRLFILIAFFTLKLMYMHVNITLSVAHPH